MRSSRWGLSIIDFHCHFPVPDTMMDWADTTYRRRHGEAKFAKLRSDWRWYQEQWWSAYGFEPPEAEEPSLDVQVRRWAAETESAGLERIVFVTGGGNEVLAEIVGTHPDRFIGFAHHDPFAPGAAQDLRVAVTELGLRGYKILAPVLRGRIDDEALDPLWQVAEQTGIPVLIHFGQLDGGGGTGSHANISPLALHDVAKAHPDVSFVVPHFGCSYPHALLQLAWSCRNVLVDTSGNNEWVRWMPYPLTVADLFAKFLDTVGPSRILFGSDSAHFPRGLVQSYYDQQLKICSTLGLSDSERDQIFAGNAARLLNIH